MITSQGWWQVLVMARWPCFYILLTTYSPVSHLQLHLPLQVRTQEEIDHNEILDFEMITFEGNLPNWQAGQPMGPDRVGGGRSGRVGAGVGG